MCLVSGCPVYTPVDFLEFLPGNRNHHHYSDDVGYHGIQLFYHCEVCHCDVEDEDAARRFPRGSLQYRHPVSERHSNRSFLLLRIVDLLVDVDDVLDVSVSEIVAFPPRAPCIFRHCFNATANSGRCRRGF